MSVADSVRRQMEQSSWIRRMFEAGIELRRERGAENVFDLSLGNPVMEPPAEFRSALQRLANGPAAGMHRYMPNAGYDETRAAVAATLRDETRIAYEAPHVMMTVGAGGAINCVLHALCDPGDEVLILKPYFAEYLFYCYNHSATPVIVDCDERFRPDLTDLASKVTARTRALLLNSPNNPSGAVYDADVLAAIADVLTRASKRYGTQIYLVSDEPYRRILFDGLTYPFPQFAYTRTITVTSHSKDLALPGERIGYAAVHPELPETGELMDALIFSNRVLGFVNAPGLMQRIVRDLQRTGIDVGVYERKRDFLYGGLVGAGYDVVKPAGAFYMFPRSPVDDELRLVDTLFNEGVLVVPGRGFGLPGYFRISFCVDDRDLEGAMPGFRRAMAALR